MTLRNFGRIVRISLLWLATIGAWGSASANEVAGPHAPGFDRVGKNVVGGMRGNRQEQVTEAARVRPSDQTEASRRALASRKSELTKRMFWIMLSMR